MEATAGSKLESGQQAAARSCPGSGQQVRVRAEDSSSSSRFVSRQRTAAAAGSCPGRGQQQQQQQVPVQAAGSKQSKFVSRQIRRNRETPARARPQRVVYSSIIQR